ncbi:MAG TPA: SDR family oxidoreductase [Bacteroidales bacterium]|nr:SDR family oxidoreductase [Bacteroidales bacterium]
MKKKLALITGASSGIGKELAYIHAEKGDDLIITARSAKKLDDLRKDLENRYKVHVTVIVKDLGIKSAASEIFNEVTSKGLIPFYLVNNAGFGDFRMFAESDWEKQEQMINVNITALTHLTRLFLPEMIRNGGGKILNTASLASFQPGPTMSVYFASKAFVLSFSEAINNELNDKGITVTALCPASTDTLFHEVTVGDPGLLKERKMDSARDVALFGYRAMMKGKPVAVYGFRNRMLVFLSRFVPRSVVVKAARKIQESKNIK